MVTRIEGKDGDFLELADTLDELPWFVAVEKEAREFVLNAPLESLPAWAREWRARQ